LANHHGFGHSRRSGGGSFLSLRHRCQESSFWAGERVVRVWFVQWVPLAWPIVKSRQRARVGFGKSSEEQKVKLDVA